ncbi:hypothetical protein QFC22_006437 [Naganishia vaughanmartiniae]|uniref:Uncharacterized protein n=1 Tax=Naganishia vaughanmartiniae TaxID=1424756 RepID=A0ACC2WJX8_9TREE|nr:hypothetical protein QFC22_006437 [Naganishia vaughanmartiniae]
MAYSLATANGLAISHLPRDYPESPSGGRIELPPRLRSIPVETISDSDRESDIAVLPGSFAASQRPGWSGAAPVVIDGTDDSHRQVVDVDMEDGDRVDHGQEEAAGLDDGEKEVVPDAYPTSEDEVEAEGNVEDEEEDDDDEESSSEDEDEEGSIDLEAEQDQDIGDSPIFVSMRNGPLGISDLLLPPAAGTEEVRVKTEPGGIENEHVQSQESVVYVGSRDPTQDITPLGGTPLTNVINSADIISFHGSSQMQESQAQPAVPPATENEATATEVNPDDTDTAVNLLVARPGKKKRIRAKSPSPPPPAAPKPRATIRVTFHLFDDNEGPDGLPVKVEANAGPPPDMKTEPQNHVTSPRMDLNGKPLPPFPETRNDTETTPSAVPSTALPVLPTVSPSSTDAAVSSAVPTAAPSAAPSVGSPTRPQTELQQDSTTAGTPKAPLPDHHGMEPKFRIVNFKDASIAQGKVDSDYYISPSGWNAVETDADDDDDDDENEEDVEVDGAETGKSKKNKKRKFQELLMNGGSGGAMKSEENGVLKAPQNMAAGDLEGAAPGSILAAMMGGSDEAELARLAAELDKKYNTTSKPKRKRVLQQDDYDYKDPFIDDSELQMDEPALLQRPVKTGYYVQKGAVELIKDENEDASPKKAKGKKQTTLNITKQPSSTKDSPVEVDEQNGEQPKRRKKMLLGRGFRPSKFGTASGSSSRQSLGLADPARDASNRLEALVYPTVVPSTPASVSVPASGTGITREQTPAIKPLTASTPASASKPVIESASATPTVPEPPRGPPKTLDEALSRLPEEIHAVLRDVNNITQALSDENWRNIKAAKRFPEQFKDPMFEVGKKAVELGLVGDALYDTLPLIIRYNRFTMKKYVLDKMRDYQIEYYANTKREVLPILKAAIDNTMEKQMSDYNAQQETYGALHEVSVE